MNFNQLRQISLTGQFNGSWGNFSTGLSKAENVAVNPPIAVIAED